MKNIVLFFILIPVISFSQPNARLQVQFYLNVLNGDPISIIGLTSLNDRVNPFTELGLGKYRLNFLDLKPGQSTTLQVFKPGYEVVNTEALEVTIPEGNKTVIILLCKKGTRSIWAEKYYQIKIENNFELQLEKLYKKLGLTENKELKGEISKYQKLLEDKSFVMNLAKQFAQTDLNLTSQKYKEAFNLYLNGDLSKADQVFPTSSLLNDLEIYKRDIGNIENKRIQLVNGFLLAGNIKFSDLQIDSAQYFYEQALSLDKNNFEVLMSILSLKILSGSPEAKSWLYKASKIDSLTEEQLIAITYINFALNIEAFDKKEKVDTIRSFISKFKTIKAHDNSALALYYIDLGKASILAKEYDLADSCFNLAIQASNISHTYKPAIYFNYALSKIYADSTERANYFLKKCIAYYEKEKMTRTNSSYFFSYLQALYIYAINNSDNSLGEKILQKYISEISNGILEVKNKFALLNVISRIDFEKFNLKKQESQVYINQLIKTVERSGYAAEKFFLLMGLNLKKAELLVNDDEPQETELKDAKLSLNKAIEACKKATEIEQMYSAGFYLLLNSDAMDELYIDEEREILITKLISGYRSKTKKNLRPLTYLLLSSDNDEAAADSILNIRDVSIKTLVLFPNDPYLLEILEEEDPFGDENSSYKQDYETTQILFIRQWLDAINPNDKKSIDLLIELGVENLLFFYTNEQLYKDFLNFGDTILSYLNKKYSINKDNKYVLFKTLEALLEAVPLEKLKEKVLKKDSFKDEISKTLRAMLEWGKESNNIFPELQRVAIREARSKIEVFLENL
jgi:hypothetical protein